VSARSVDTVGPSGSARTGARDARLAALRRELPRDLFLLLAFNTVLAVFITTLLPRTTFADNFVHSQSIGLVLWLLIDVTRIALWPDRGPPAVPLALVVAAALPVGYFVGRAIAQQLVGPVTEGAPAVHWPSVAITIAACIVATFFLAAHARAARLAAEAAESRARGVELERQAAEARFRLLAAQVEPHFLFNTLANLRALIETDPPRALGMLDHLDGYLRASLAAARHERVPLAREFALVEDYLAIVAIRMGARLSWRLELPEKLAGISVPPMLLQPLVENAVRHGLEPRVESGEVIVAAREQEGRLVIEVTDTGLGLRADANPGSGVGVHGIRDTYGPAAALSLADHPPRGTRATLILPGTVP
jgi:signal transduction histidine kinase